MNDFKQNVLEVDGVVVVDFTARWCPPCRALRPVLQRVGEAHPQVRVYEIDVDEHPDVVARYGVTSVPTLIRFESGEPVRMQIGGDQRSLERLFD